MAKSPDKIIEEMAKPFSFGTVEDWQNGAFDDFTIVETTKKIFPTKREQELLRQLPMPRLEDLFKECWRLTNGPTEESEDGKNS